MSNTIESIEYPKEEWSELVTLDYVLTRNYTDNYERDFKRYRQLSDKWWGMYEFKKIISHE
jgi:hypothetical protein